MPRRFLLAVLFGVSPLVVAGGNLHTPPDNRVTINITAAERNQMLTEMREFLHGIYNIQLALAKKDMNAVAISAKPMGPMLDRITASLKEKLPEQFHELAIAQNEAFQNLARNAEKKGDLSLALEQTAEIFTYCSGCHDAFRFEVKPPAKPRK